MQRVQRAVVDCDAGFFKGVLFHIPLEHLGVFGGSRSTVCLRVHAIQTVLRATGARQLRCGEPRL